MGNLTERQALDLIRATATRTVPRCINLEAIDRILTDVAATPAPAAPLAAAPGENPLAVVASVLHTWLDENEATDFDENDVAHLFAQLGTCGYSVVPNWAVLGWVLVNEQLPAMLPDEYTGANLEAEAEDAAAMRCSADVLVGYWQTHRAQTWWVVKKARYYEASKCWYECESGAWLKPSHWQPLPAAPTANAGEEPGQC